MFDHYSKILFQFSISYLKSKESAEEVVQEVFIKIWDNRKKLKTDTSFKSYLFTIALNSIRNSLIGKQNRLN
ncbi:RNA polymerase sigma factor [uncultured Sunxiuqinia sp.]|uniref:RNA polymerase sigma factor n=1 Tax=uncultured Sunxiuqinia sp. TaxID=1573825 RepID=UPI0037481AB5